MARVKITLTCADCGAQFEHIHFCRNSTEASSYEGWARENITACPKCYAAGKKAQTEAHLSAYIADISATHPLPKITGVSEKQIAYAAKLREGFIVNDLMGFHVDLQKFFKYSDAVRFEKLSAADQEKARGYAEQAGKTIEAWFSDYRIEKLYRAAHLPNKSTVSKIEAIFSEPNAGKLIEALR